MVDVSVIGQYVFDLLVLYTFGNIYLATAFIVIFFMILQYKLGLSSDTIAASTAGILLALGGLTLPIDWIFGTVAIGISIIMFIAILKLRLFQ